MDKAKNILREKDINDALLQNEIDKLGGSKEISINLKKSIPDIQITHRL